MLYLRGILRAATQVGGGVKNGQPVPVKSLLQIETKDERGLYQVTTIAVPDLQHFAGKVDQTVNVPVRAWARDATVNYVYAHFEGTPA